MWTKTAKSPAFSNFLFSFYFLRSCLWFPASQGLFFCLLLAKSNQRWFFFGLASGSLRARGFLFASGSPKAIGVGLYSSPGAFSSVLPLVPCEPGAFLLPLARKRQTALACTARRVLFLRSCLWLLAGQGLFFCLSRAKGKRRLSLQCLLCLLRPCMRGFFPYPSSRPVLPCFPPSLLRPTPAFQSPDTTKNAPYDQRPNGALWWALRNSNP